MPISPNQGKRVYDTRRTVTWERYVLVSNGFHECVLHSSRYPLIGLTRRPGAISVTVPPENLVNRHLLLWCILYM